jgi:TolB protein
MSPHLPRRFARYFVWLLFALIGHSASSVEITISKTATDQNPSLYLEMSGASPALQQAFRRTLLYADWFALVPQRETARYHIRLDTASGNLLRVEVSEAGKPLTQIMVPLSTSRPAESARRAVDQLIATVFNNPGPCASQIAFAVAQQGYKEIFTCPFDGSTFSQLTRNRSISTEPSWGGDTTRLVYTLYQGNRTQIVLMDTVGQRQRRLAAYPGLNSSASLSPDGQRLVLALSRNNQVDLFVRGLDPNSRLQQLTNDRAVESSATWSPDGREICYVSDQAGRPQLYLISLRTGRSRRLLRDPAEAVSPDWSPVSNRLCFATRHQGRYVPAWLDMNATSPSKTIITEAPGNWESPSWGPDGRHLVCSQEDGRGSRIVIVDSWYGRSQPLTESGDYSLPDWGTERRPAY